MEFLEVIKEFVLLPGEYLLACFVKYGLIIELTNKDFEILRYALAAGSWLSLSGYLFFCVDDSIDEGPRFPSRFRKLKGNAFEFSIMTLMLLVFYLSLDCLIRITILLIGMYFFYYSVGERERPPILGLIKKRL